MAEPARAAGLKDVRLFDSIPAAADALRGELRAGDHLLVKGSRAAGLEALVDALVAR